MRHLSLHTDVFDMRLKFLFFCFNIKRDILVQKIKVRK